jgi:hypothetical protein
VLRKRKVEAHGDFILGPVSPKEYKDTVAELNGSRTNRVFEFFKINPPERVGFAKHREAAEKKAAAVATAEADAEETATSPRAAPQKTGRRGAPAAATAAAEGKARKKRGGRPADSPPSPKRTRVVDVETGLVEDVIAAVPLRAAAPSDAPSARAGKEAAEPLLVRLQVPAEAKLIGGKTIRFLGLTSGGHERQFLEEAGASFAIPHEEEHFGKLTAAELTTACGDLSLKAFITSRCLARRLEQESKESKERSVAAVFSLENRVAELEGRLAAEQERTRRLQQEKEDAAKSSEAVLKTLRHDMEILSSAK